MAQNDWRRKNNMVRQSHDPERRLFGRVVQPRGKARSALLSRLGRSDKTKRELEEDLRRAVQNTAVLDA